MLALAVVGCGGSEFDEKTDTAKKDDGPAETIDATEERERQSFIRQKAEGDRIAYQELAEQAAIGITRLQEYRAELAAWQTLTAELPTNDDGRAIASDPSFVQSYIELTAKPRHRLDDVDAAIRKLTRIQDNSETQAKQDLPSITPQKRQEDSITIASERAQAEEQTAELKKDTALILGFIAAGRTNPTGVTLAEAIRTANAQAAAERADLIAQERERVYRENSERMAELEAQKEQERQDAKASQLAREALETKAADPTIIAKFAPFTTRGQLAFDRFSETSRSGTTVAGSVWMKQINGPSRPASYSKLTQLGATKNVQNFVWFGCDCVNKRRGYPDNDRPVWSYPQNDDEWRYYEELLELFKELAPIWAENGILAP